MHTCVLGRQFHFPNCDLKLVGLRLRDPILTLVFNHNPHLSQAQTNDSFGTTCLLVDLKELQKSPSTYVRVGIRRKKFSLKPRLLSGSPITEIEKYIVQ